ncbi:MAG: acyltransferase family protein [Beduini sp.]|uniref:acyltransferase family protein n=1 Tax=Beduini sp. TaxID=1922300 RepID=UPI0039904D80
MIKMSRDTGIAMNNYKILDVMKYIAAIMVICIHCGPLFEQPYLNFFIKQIVCRIAVPFFFISSAYFIRKGSDGNPIYVTSYLKRLIKSYWAWSLVFIPIGLDWIHQNLSIAGYLLPFALIYGLIHLGTYYHLWYVPALIFSVYTINKLLKRYSYKILFIIAVVLFVFGSFETYYGLLPEGVVKNCFDLLIQVIFTTRSGLFFGMIFTLIGFYIYDHQENLRLLKYVPLSTLVCTVLLVLEGTFLYSVERLDMNFLLMLVPFSFFFFIWLLSVPYTPKYDTKKIRGLSKYYYFIHPVCIVIVEEIGRAYSLDIFSSGIISLLFVVMLTHLLSCMMLKIKTPLRKVTLLWAALLGIGLTFIIASTFFWFKPMDIVIKFELVPCLWFYCSFILYYILYKQNNKTKEMI